MQKMFALKLGTLVFGALNVALCAAAATAPALSQTLPQSTAIPVRFVHSLDAKKAKVGDTVTAETMQVITLPGGEKIATDCSVSVASQWNDAPGPEYPDAVSLAKTPSLRLYPTASPSSDAIVLSSGEKVVPPMRVIMPTWSVSSVLCE